MITLAHTITEAVEAQGEFRAGGTDVQERRRSGVSRGPIIDLTRLSELNQIEWNARGAARLGALVPMAMVASDKRIQQGYPGLAATAGALATPQIRTLGTLGGNLLQRTRCWYYRHPAISCFKKGGNGCPARVGNHLYGVCFDLGPCVAPHPSTLGMVLLAYEAQVEIYKRSTLSIAELYGDGSDPALDHRLGQSELLTGVVLPEPVKGERAAYFRAISRARAEWPLVEAVVRVVADDTIRLARVAVGGVAPIPLRLPAVEAALVGQSLNVQTLERAAAVAAEGAEPLPLTKYKVALLQNTVLETLERACS